VALAQQYGMAQPVDDLLYSDINGRLAGKIQSAQFLGRENVSGHACNQFAFKQANLSWRIWIEDGHKPVPWKLVVSYDTSPGRPQYALVVTEFETPIFMPDGEFKATVPDGAISASLTNLAGGSGGTP
jgi:hypothetical protein